MSRLVPQRRLLAARVRAGLTGRYCIVHGNCQAEPVRQLLASSPGFPYVTVALPPVHEMTAPDADLLHRLLPRTAVFVAQPVYDGYQGLPIGTDQLRALLPADARTVLMPVHYYEGLHPFQVHVRVDGYPVPAPVTTHHDLRFLHCAARGADDAESLQWLQDWVPPTQAVRDHADQSLGLLMQREQHLDTVISDRIRPAAEQAFFTLNHPSNALLATTAERVLGVLGLSARVSPPPVEYLDGQRAPVEPGIAVALGVQPSADQAWWVDGTRHPLPDLLRRHLAWYRERPELVALGQEQHADRLRAFGLA